MEFEGLPPPTFWGDAHRGPCRRALPYGAGRHRISSGQLANLHQTRYEVDACTIWRTSSQHSVVRLALCGRNGRSIRQKSSVKSMGSNLVPATSASKPTANSMQNLQNEKTSHRPWRRKVLGTPNQNFPLHGVCEFYFLLAARCGFWLSTLRVDVVAFCSLLIMFKLTKDGNKFLYF